MAPWVINLVLFFIVIKKRTQNASVKLLVLFTDRMDRELSYFVWIIIALEIGNVNLTDCGLFYIPAGCALKPESISLPLQAHQQFSRDSEPVRCQGTACKKAALFLQISKNTNKTLTFSCYDINKER